MRKAQVVQLLECEPELAEGLAEEERAVAARLCRSALRSLTKGVWKPQRGSPRSRATSATSSSKACWFAGSRWPRARASSCWAEANCCDPGRKTPPPFAASWEVVGAVRPCSRWGRGLTRGLCSVADDSREPRMLGHPALAGAGRRRRRANIVGIEERLLTRSGTWPSAGARRGRGSPPLDPSSPPPARGDDGGEAPLDHQRPGRAEGGGSA